MKILRLQSSNIMRLVAVDIAPDGNLIMIGGKNGAGKSSVLNSIAMALGGMALVPDEPLRAGESEGEIRVDLGDLVVTRTFKRSRLACNCAAFNTPNAQSEDKSLHAPTCNWASGEWSDTTSTLIVTNADNTARYNSPQAMLDKLLGRLTFDPLAFLNDPKQGDTLGKLVGIDVRDFAARRAAAAAERLAVKRRYEAKAAVVEQMPLHKDAPAEEIPMKEISDEMLKAEEYRRLADEAQRAVDKAKDDVTVAKDQLRRVSTQIEMLQKQLEDLNVQEGLLTARASEAESALDAAGITAQAARAVVPDAAALRARLAEAEAVNARVRANAARAAGEREAAALAAEIDLHHEAVVRIDEEREAALRAAKFPVEGLGLGDDGVTFHGLPFKQASSAEQLRVSVAIGLALNPTLKVLLVRSGNMLDEDSLASVAKQVEEADAQVWVEWVTKDAKDVSVMIEDGKVVSG